MKIIQYGIGPIGQKITRLLLKKTGCEIVAAIDIDPEKKGRSLGDIVGQPDALDVPVQDDAARTLSSAAADIVVLTTSSTLESIAPQILEIVSHGLNVVTTCEELAYPMRTNPELAAKLDQAARLNNVSILSTGINPGFLMDFLPATLTGICVSVDTVRIERFQNAQMRRIPFQQKIGAGLSTAEFQERVEKKTLRHVGLTESIHMIADALGWELTKTEDIIEPVIATERVVTPDLTIEPGFALGVNQTGRGFIGEREVISLLFRAAIGEKDPRDRIIVNGEPSIDSTIKGGINGDIGTCSITVNAVPAVIKARPGLRTMIDIESITCFA